MTSSEIMAARGLYDGFEAYRAPTEDGYQSVLKSGLVVPDTNVLLHLYRYNSQTRQDLFRVLASLESRLWVPNQVIAEFWRNRESSSRGLRDAANTAIGIFEKSRQSTAEALSAWLKRVALDGDRGKSMREEVERLFENLIAEIEGLVESDGLEQIGDSRLDPVLKELEATLASKVGSPFSAGEISNLRKVGQERLVNRTPPGYMDKSKDGDGRLGDYLLWEQILREATARKCDVLFVTGDDKEDWWHKDHGETRGPRLELVQELWDRAGVQLYMMNPQRFISSANLALNVGVSNASVQDIERVDRSIQESMRQGNFDLDLRFQFVKLPGIPPGEYLPTLTSLARFALDDPTRDVYESRVQSEFSDELMWPGLDLLAMLRLAHIGPTLIRLTMNGREFALGQEAFPLGEERSFLQRVTVERILGASEILNMPHEAPGFEFPADFFQSPPAGLPPARAVLLVNWMQEIHLI